MTEPSIKQYILSQLSPEEQQELNSAVYALGVVNREDHGPGDEIMNPDGLSAMLRQLSPRVKQTLVDIYKLTGEERNAPFQPKLQSGDYAELLDLDPRALDRVRNTLASAEVAGDLVDRMAPKQVGQDVPGVHARQALRGAYDAHMLDGLAQQSIADYNAETGRMMQAKHGDKSLRESLQALMESQ